MKLLDRHGYRSDDFGRSIVPLSELATTRGADAVAVANTTDVEALTPYFPQLALIAIDFPSFADGRGFSLARRLRRAGFGGRLRAVGPLIPDQAPHAFACGFDEIQTPDANERRHSEEHWRNAPHAVSPGYQPDYASQPSIFAQRKTARQGVSHA